LFDRRAKIVALGLVLFGERSGRNKLRRAAIFTEADSCRPKVRILSSCPKAMLTYVNFKRISARDQEMRLGKKKTGRCTYGTDLLEP
jgi:hypothetical protein